MTRRSTIPARPVLMTGSVAILLAGSLAVPAQPLLDPPRAQEQETNSETRYAKGSVQTQVFTGCTDSEGIVDNGNQVGDLRQWIRIQNNHCDASSRIVVQTGRYGLIRE